LFNIIVLSLIYRKPDFVHQQPLYGNWVELSTGEDLQDVIVLPPEQEPNDGETSFQEPDTDEVAILDYTYKRPSAAHEPQDEDDESGQDEEDERDYDVEESESDQVFEDNPRPCGSHQTPPLEYLLQQVESPTCSDSSSQQPILTRSKAKKLSLRGISSSSEEQPHPVRKTTAKPRQKNKIPATGPPTSHCRRKNMKAKARAKAKTLPHRFPVGYIPMTSDSDFEPRQTRYRLRPKSI
jgi:hypothetical protein